jgi:hypothetical protein
VPPDPEEPIVRAVTMNLSDIQQAILAAIAKIKRVE